MVLGTHHLISETGICLPGLPQVLKVVQHAGNRDRHFQVFQRSKVLWDGFALQNDQVSSLDTEAEPPTIAVLQTFRSFLGKQWRIQWWSSRMPTLSGPTGSTRIFMDKVQLHPSTLHFRRKILVHATVCDMKSNHRWDLCFSFPNILLECVCSQMAILAFRWIGSGHEKPCIEIGLLHQWWCRRCCWGTWSSLVAINPTWGASPMKPTCRVYHHNLWRSDDNGNSGK